MMRRLLTAEFVDGLVPPTHGEIWIADTEVRGFGVRLWAHRSGTGKVFCIRKTDKNGRSIRKTFQPFADGGTFIRWGLRQDQSLFDPDNQLILGLFLESAREWARVEIDRIKGRIPSHAEMAALDAERDATQADSGARLKQHTLGRLVDIILENGHARRWNESYCDRLRHAFNQFDPDDQIRKLKLSELDNGGLSKFIEESRLSPGNLRLLRSLFNVTFWNIHHLGGPPIGRILPHRRVAFRAQNQGRDDFFETMKKTEMERLLQYLRESNADWRSRSAIALSCLFWAPVSRVLKARWSEIIDDRWLPYAPVERKYWYAKWERIDSVELEWLTLARTGADTEGISSAFWFPSPINPDQPLANIDRTWFQALDHLNWPRMSLTKFGAETRRRLFFFEWPDNIKRTESRRAEIIAQLASWPSVRSTSKKADV